MVCSNVGVQLLLLVRVIVEASRLIPPIAGLCCRALSSVAEIYSPYTKILRDTYNYEFIHLGAKLSRFLVALSDLIQIDLVALRLRRLS